MPRPREVALTAGLIAATTGVLTLGATVDVPTPDIHAESIGTDRTGYSFYDWKMIQNPTGEGTATVSVKSFNDGHREVYGIGRGLVRETCEPASYLAREFGFTSLRIAQYDATTNKLVMTASLPRKPECNDRALVPEEPFRLRLLQKLLAPRKP